MSDKFNIKKYISEGKLINEQDIQDTIYDLEQAQDMLAEVIDLIRQALRGTNQITHAESYILSNLENWIDSKGYDMGIQQYIDEIKEEQREKGINL